MMALLHAVTQESRLIVAHGPNRSTYGLHACPQKEEDCVERSHRVFYITQARSDIHHFCSWSNGQLVPWSHLTIRGLVGKCSLLRALQGKEPWALVSTSQVLHNSQLWNGFLKMERAQEQDPAELSIDLECRQDMGVLETLFHYWPQTRSWVRLLNLWKFTVRQKAQKHKK